MAVRFSLGALRGQVIRQLLMEAILVASGFARAGRGQAGDLASLGRGPSRGGNCPADRSRAAAAHHGESGHGVQHRLEQTLAKLESIPGVAWAAIALNPPASGANYNLEIHIAGRDSRAPREKLLANAPAVSASYFRTLGTRFLPVRRAAIISILSRR